MGSETSIDLKDIVEFAIKNNSLHGLRLDNVSYYPSGMAQHFMRERLGPYCQQIIFSLDHLIRHVDAQGSFRLENENGPYGVLRISKLTPRSDIGGTGVVSVILIPPQSMEPQLHTIKSYVVRSQTRASIYTEDVLGSGWSLHVGDWK